MGFNLVRITVPEKVYNWFEFDKSCQIPFLSSIYSQIFGTEKPGFLVEVGAFDAITYSNSSGLLEKGWSGILIEPVPEFAEKCRKRYFNNTKVRIVEKAISNKIGMQRLDSAGPLSTLSSELISEYRTLEWSRPSTTNDWFEVETITLDETLKIEGVSPNFELLIVDVEGFESEVFEGFTLEHWKPKMIVVELSDFHPNLESHKRGHFHLGENLLSAGYKIIYKDAINTIFVQTNILYEKF